MSPQQDLDEFADKLVESGVASPHQILGCTEAEIAAVLDKAQGFPLPEHFVAFLRRMGRGAGRLLVGTDAFYPASVETADAVREFAEGDPALRLSGRFFFANHQGYQWYFFDEASPGKVFLYSEGVAEPQLLAETFLDFLQREAGSAATGFTAGQALQPMSSPTGFPMAPPVDPSELRPVGKGWKVALAVGIPVLVVVILSVILGKTTPAAPSAVGSQASKTADVSSAVGDCLQGDVGNSHVTPAACGPGARYQVIGRVEGQSELQVTMGTSACDPFPTANAIYWKGESDPLGGLGTVLCLQDTTLPTVPVTGDCLKGELSDSKSVAKVECGPDAAYQVVAREKTTSIRGLGGTPPCEQVPATSATYSWSWENSPLASTSVLCLQDLKNPDNHAPVVGDCLTFPNDTSVHFVPCGKGKLKVLGKIAKTSQFEGALKPASEVCHDFPGSDRAYWQGFQNDLVGTTYCLDTLRK